MFLICRFTPYYTEYAYFDTLILKMLWSNILLSLFPLLSLTAASTPPPPPALSYLYTAYVQCAGNLMETDGPYGLRKTIPIVGGNFTGPRLSGIPYILLPQRNPHWSINPD